MIIALHNIAVEYEYLKQYQSALLTYKKASDFANKMLGEEHPFTTKMDAVLEESSEKVQAIMQRQEKRAVKFKANTNSAPRMVRGDKAKLKPGQIAPENNDLETLLDQGLTLDEAKQPGNLNQKKGTVGSVPRMNRSPPRGGQPFNKK